MLFGEIIIKKVALLHFKNALYTPTQQTATVRQLKLASPLSYT